MIQNRAVLWTSSDAERATNGRSTQDWQAYGISIDTRSIQAGDIFIALKGDHSDGHLYVKNALEKGAAAAIVSEVPEGLDSSAPLLIVQDTLKAMEDLGQASRHRSAAKIIAVTGSVGKTGTKAMLAAAFGAQGQTHASQASFNNHWGVPFSLADMDAGSDYGIFEIGMNHSGEITNLTTQVKPDIAIITTVAAAHMGNFESVEEIARAKAEIFDGVKEGGAAVLNANNEWFGLLKELAENKGLKVYTFGEGDNYDAQLMHCLEAANGSRVTAKVLDEEIQFTLPIPGRHIVQNLLSVLLAVKLAGGSLQKAAQALQKAEGLAGRGRQEIIQSREASNPITLIDESYNASPIAMRAAFKVLALIDPGRGGRRIAVLGDMRELGDDAARLHAELALPLEAAGVQLVYTCGPLMKNLYNALPQDKRGAHHDDSKEMAKIVPEVLVPGDVVLVKGSRGGGEKPRMQVIVEALRSLPTNAPAS